MEREKNRQVSVEHLKCLSIREFVRASNRCLKATGVRPPVPGMHKREHKNHLSEPTHDILEGETECL